MLVTRNSKNWFGWKINIRPTDMLNWISHKIITWNKNIWNQILHVRYFTIDIHPPSLFFLNMIIYHPLVMPTFHWFRNKHILNIKHYSIPFFPYDINILFNISFNLKWERERYDDISIIPNHKTQQGNQTILFSNHWEQPFGMRGEMDIKCIYVP